MRIPTDMLPADGRFASGPAKVRREALSRLGQRHDLMGTSHRQPPVKDVVGRLKSALSELYGLPDGYQVVLGNGGATLMWDVVCCSLTRQRAAYGVFGVFGEKAARASANAPFLADPLVLAANPGGVAVPGVTKQVDLSGIDVVSWPHNETSTGVLAPVDRPDTDALVVVDATSAAGAVQVDLSLVDVYYFSPQKALASDGGLWIAICSPRALERAEELTAAGGRWVPDLLNLTKAASNSAKNQTLNTPAIATLLLAVDQLEWLLAQGGMDFAARRTRESAGIVYDWAMNHPMTEPFVAYEALRSPVVATLELDASIPAPQVSALLRDSGVVDVGGYRGVGTNQLRFGLFPAVEPDDVRQLTRCLDWTFERLSS